MRGQGGERGRRRYTQYTDTRKTRPRPPTGTAGEVNHDILEAKGRGSSEKTSPPRWWPPSGTREAGEKDEAAQDGARSRRWPQSTRLRTGARRSASHPEGLRLRGRPGGRRASLRPSPAPAPEAPEESGACDFCAQGEVKVANNFRGGSAATSVGEKYVSSASVESLTLHGRGEVGENNLSYSASPGRMGLPAPRPSVAV